MNRINIIDLAEPLAIRHKLTREEAQDFLEQVFTVIRDGIEQEGAVKVRGLGTFKATNVEARESVNVNTGERFVIDSHAKLSFMPDPAMREVVNKPFSLFDTVLLNDGVDFSDIDNDGGEENMANGSEEQALPEQSAPTPEPESIESISEEEPLPAPTAEEPLPVSPAEEPLPAPTAEEPLPDAPVEETDEENGEPTEEDEHQDEEATQHVEAAEEEVQAVEDAEEVPTAEDTEEAPTAEEDEWEEETGGRKKLWWAALVALVAALVVFSVVYKDELTNAFAPKGSSALATDSVVAAQADTAKIDSSAQVPVPKTSIPSNVLASEKDTLPDYDAMDARIRTGAYRIVGMDYSIKAREGETMEHLTKRTLGPGMECYIETYNGIKGPLSGGQVVKIPKLQLKKKLKQK